MPYNLYGCHYLVTGIMSTAASLGFIRKRKTKRKTSGLEQEGLRMAGAREEGSGAQEWHWKQGEGGSWLPQGMLFLLWLLAALHPHLFQSEL